jgi:diguanylate cyclase (GGDEF)-like protein
MGDHIICALTQALKRNLSRPDLIGRGGDTTFAVLLPHLNSASAAVLLSEFQEKLPEKRKKFSQPITFSISAMICARTPSSVAQLKQEAETRMRHPRVIGQDNFDLIRVDSVSLFNLLCALNTLVV